MVQDKKVPVAKFKLQAAKATKRRSGQRLFLSAPTTSQLLLKESGDVTVALFLSRCLGDNIHVFFVSYG